jgi:hypothetical protein
VSRYSLLVFLSVSCHVTPNAASPCSVMTLFESDGELAHLVILHPVSAFEALTTALHLVQDALLGEVRKTHTSP